MHTDRWPRTVHLDNDVAAQVGEAHAAYDLDLVVHLYPKAKLNKFESKAKLQTDKVRLGMGFFFLNCVQFRVEGLGRKGPRLASAQPDTHQITPVFEFWSARAVCDAKSCLSVRRSCGALADACYGDTSLDLHAPPSRHATELHLSTLLDKCAGGPPCKTDSPKEKESMVVTVRLFFDLIETLPL